VVSGTRLLPRAAGFSISKTNRRAHLRIDRTIFGVGHDGHLALCDFRIARVVRSDPTVRIVGDRSPLLVAGYVRLPTNGATQRCPNWPDLGRSGGFAPIGLP